MDPESGAESSLSPSEATGEGDDNTPKVDPLKWSVSLLLSVFDTITIIKLTVTGCRSV